MELSNGKRGGLFTAFVDFRKVFDGVDRTLLVCKLAQLGIKGRILKVIEAIHTNTVNILQINNIFTDEFGSDKGVLQGNNISPTLFSIYIDGLLQELKTSGEGFEISQGKKISALAYADDVVLISRTESGLHRLLKIVERWCYKWRISVNAAKMKVVHFRKKKTPRMTAGFVLTENIEIVSNYKYLGILVNEHLNADSYIDQLAKAASRGLGNLIGKTNGNLDLSYAVFTKLYHSCIAPIMDYRSRAWSLGGSAAKLDAVQNRAIRYFCGLPKTTPILRLEGDMDGSWESYAGTWGCYVCTTKW